MALTKEKYKERLIDKKITEYLNILSLFKQSADGELAIYCRNIYR